MFLESYCNTLYEGSFCMTYDVIVGVYRAFREKISYLISRILIFGLVFTDGRDQAIRESQSKSS